MPRSSIIDIRYDGGMPRVVALLVFAHTAFAQQALVPTLLEYLDLTAAQVTRLRQNAADYNKFYSDKVARYVQVDRELADEHARDVVDPLALGQRYVEQEAICRELRAAHQQNFERNQTVLTPAQRTRLSALDAVASNASLANSAIRNNLVELPANTFADPLSWLLGGFGGGFGGGLGGGWVGSAFPGPPAGIGEISICGVPRVSATPILFNRTKPQTEVR
jgi:hypothetical protein